MAIQLSKAGFTRLKEKDFSDDGTRYQVYGVGEHIEITKYYCGGTLYLDCNIKSSILTSKELDYLPSYREINKITNVAAYRLEGNLEGTRELYTLCLKLEDEVKKVEQTVHIPTDEEMLKAKELRIKFFQQEIDDITGQLKERKSLSDLIGESLEREILNDIKFNLRYLYSNLETILNFNVLTKPSIRRSFLANTPMKHTTNYEYAKSLLNLFL